MEEQAKETLMAHNDADNSRASSYGAAKTSARTRMFIPLPQSNNNWLSFWGREERGADRTLSC